MRAWIEINAIKKGKEIADVALFVRAWIEIVTSIALTSVLLVALFVRAWIEITLYCGVLLLRNRRSLRESVD